MLTLVNIAKTYGKDIEKVEALKGISINFRRNEFVSILGPSGCGKTTLLNIIGGLDRYTSGDLIIEGYSTKEFNEADWNNYRNKKIGFVFQSYNLIPHLTVLKNVEISLTLSGVDSNERRKRAIAVLEKVGLLDKANKKPNQLSGGQMQRVAIARSLINEPEIILADEPTGALDSESGVQVLDLLKEVASDRLVIMVTHNGDLANKYSTRIIQLVDGLLTEDSNPYSLTEAISDSRKEGEDSSALEDLLVHHNLFVADGAEVINGNGESYENESYEETEINGDSFSNDKAETKADARKKRKNHFKILEQNLFKSLSQKSSQPSKKGGMKRQVRVLFRRKKKHGQKSSMSLSTAIGLSYRNLLSKKTRTIITAIASSIGIIGILLVLALSTGANAFIAKSEENALSQFPIRIEKQSVDAGAIIKILQSTEDNRPDYPSEDTVYTKEVLGALVKNAVNVFGENDLKAVKDYLDTEQKEFMDEHGYVKYGFSTQLHVYTDYAKKKIGQEGYTKTTPYKDSMAILTSSGADALKPVLDKARNLEIPEWDEMIDNEKLLKQQYELVGKNSKWAREYNEVMIVLDRKNQLTDFSLFTLGLIPETKIWDALLGELKDPQFTVDELLSIQYRVATSADYCYLDADGKWQEYEKTNQTAEFVNDENTIPVKVVGVIRPKQEANVTSINGVIAYTSKLNKYMIDRAHNHPAMLAQEASDKNILTGATLNSIQKLEALEEMGKVNTETPKAIKIFANSFKDKEAIIAMLDNAKVNGKTIKYADQLELIMGYVGTLTKTITGVLVGFSAISLAVSSIMISIIIYTSVLERRKEIGVLRSLGARKIDISNVFNAESGMIGILSGIIATIVSFAVSIGASVALESKFGIKNLLSLQWYHVVLMIIVSCFLSLLAGFIPARIASQRDPATALRSD